MILKRLRLNNIRSYINQEILFPAGSTLLAGDIGCGKSTILLAVEFALFGAKKTDLPASALLRHGKNTGTVELTLELEGKEIIVSRNLKRGKLGISQETGFIVVNGIKTEGTHVELKARMLELLGYPEDLVSKSKDLVYRYTVYTPQEEMKRILMEKKEERLDTLRKVFNIDKYKKIKENASLYIRNLKEKRKIYESNIVDLEEKQRNKKEKEIEIKEIEIKIEALKPDLEDIKETLNKKKESILTVQKKIEDLNKFKREFFVNEENLKNKLDLRQKNKINIDKIENEIKVLEKELGEKDYLQIDDLKKEIQANNSQVVSIEKKSLELNYKIAETNLEIKRSKELRDKILGLSKCPTCHQEVSKGYKDNIIENQKISLTKLDQVLASYTKEDEGIKNMLKPLKEKNELLKKRESSLELIRFKIKNIENRKKEVQELNLMQDEIKKQIGQINMEKIELNEKIEKFKDAEEEYKKARIELEELQTKEKKIELQKTAYEKEKEGIQKLLLLLEEDINKKLMIKEKLNYVMQLQNWLESYFINMINTIEKHVMLKVYNEFNDLFKDWFSILIEDEGINVRLDEEFTPIIEQNGYETFYENLSGGERTSVALSYRLALNKVINDVAGEIKTKDIIMLDEPTDGFSTEQLDKIRDVLEQLNMKQVIIVSHEDKIESFVENVIRVTKEEHVSQVS